MFADTFRLVWTDLLVTLMQGAMSLVRLTSKDRYSGRLAEAAKMAEEWREKRRELVPNARKLTRGAGLTVFCVGVVILSIANGYAAQLKAMNPPQAPILVSEIAWVVLFISCLALFVAALASDPNTDK